jgi:CDP-6-deoxy-D-xylo-4-hexulose-3-dehydrase
MGAKKRLKKQKKFTPGKDRILYGGTIFGKSERKAIEKILDINWWGLSKEGSKFEKEIARFQRVKRAVFVNSGTSALDLGIRALGLPKGSEVIIPACEFPTVVASLIREGLKPVIADIELGSYFYSIKSLERSITKNTSAILIVYIAGIAGDLDKVLRLSKKHKLKIIEDNCEGFGGVWKSKMLGSFGDFSATSTHPAHIISTGGGGVFFTNNNKLADKVVSLRDWGRITDFENRKENIGIFPAEYRRYLYSGLGSNYHPLELQAAMGRVQLKRLPSFKRIRKRNYEILYKRLKTFKDSIILPEAHKNADCCWYTFPITLINKSRKKMLKALDTANIEWRPILTGNVAYQPGFENQVIKRVKTPNADRLINDSFWVSVHPQHSSGVMNYVADKIIEAVS